MRKLRVLLVLFLVLSLPFASEGSSISGPEVKLVNNDIYVSFSLAFDEKVLQEVKNGIDKELKFYVDLFRVWKVWPDEFVLGKLYAKTLRVDPIKKEYLASSNDGNVLIEKKFRSFETMLDWTLAFRDIKLTNTRELEPGQYFVRITVESRIRKLPPVLGHILIFVPENEFKIRKDSAPVVIEGIR